jgi:membrane fusion protein, multidrug efflux system
MSYQKRTKRAGVLVVVTVAALLMGAAVVTLVLRERESAPEAMPPPEVPVEVTPVSTVTLEETIQGIGTLRATATVSIQPELPGRVRAIPFQEGSTVEQGQVLFEIDDSKLQSQLAARQAGLRSAEVRLANAQRSLERQQQLFARGIVAEDEMDRAQMELDTATAEQERFAAEVALIDQQLRDTIIVAPFTGEISQRNVDAGAYVGIGDVLATVYQADPLEVEFSVPERHLGRLQLGQSAAIIVAAYPQRSFDGTVIFVSPAVDEATRTFQVRATVPNPQRELKPGAFATVVVTVGVREDRPVVPEESLVATRTGYIVFVIEDGVARSQQVQAGLRRAGMVEIMQGLDPGDQVVRTGHLRLRGGERVQIVDSNDVPGSSAQDQALAGHGGPE